MTQLVARITIDLDQGTATLDSSEFSEGAGVALSAQAAPFSAAELTELEGMHVDPLQL
ncbi:MAG: hypothetical protein H7146_07215 [Burkholderiaceae bacterium]|nr:hypothetical protein [Microbacteriaceae bacterium]